MTTASPSDAAVALVAAVTAADPRSALSEYFAGVHRDAIPEVLALAALSDDPYGELHKDNFEHSLKVVAQCGSDASLTTRLAALFHDVGKPACRVVRNGEVTFHAHEEVGVKLTRSRLRALGFNSELVADVCTVVLASGRVQSFLDTWTDAAIRRVTGAAGDLLPEALTLARADCTTKHQWKRDRLHALIARFEARVAEVTERDRRAAERPVLNGDQLAELGIARGPQMGQLLRWLLDENRQGRLLDPSDAATAVLGKAS